MEKSDINEVVKMGEEPMQDRLNDVLKLVSFVPSSVPFWVYSPFLFWLPEKQRQAMDTFLGRPRIRKAGLKMMKMLAVYVKELATAKAEGKKVIMHPFNFAPEIVHAFDGAVSMSSELMTTLAAIVLEGGSEYYLDLGEELGFPDSLCSASRASGAAVLKDLLPRPDVIVTSGVGSCDPNAKLHEILAERCNVPFVCVEEAYVRDDWGLEYHKKTYKESVERLEEILGEEIDTNRLRGVMEKSNRATELYMDMMELRKAVPCPVPNIFGMFTQGARLSMWGRDEAIDLMEIMLKTSKMRAKRGEGPPSGEKIRSIWIYNGAYFDLSGLWHWLEEEKGVSYLIDGLTYFTASPIDTTSRESMLDGLAEQSWNLPMNRNVGGFGDYWINDTLYLCKDLKADCAIFGGHLACKNLWGMVRLAADRIRDEVNIPFLRLEVDGWDARVTSSQTLQQELSDFFDTMQEMST